MLKKTLLSLIILFCGAAATFALPGFTSFVPDTAGEYVWYRDNSFARESYIGLLNYDDTSYQIRYYAPADRSTAQPEKELAILFALNPQADYIDMTGEKIITEVNPGSEDDVDILNYLHDIIYEFSARRIKAGQLDSTPISLSQEYEQFGGKVTINFDSLVPLFNIKNIKASDGTVIFSCVTFGRIISGQDTSFEDFHGLLAAKPYHAPLKNKIKGKTAKFTTQDGQKITLDTNWQAAADNMWIFGEEAFLTIATVPAYFEDKALNDLFILRRITESTGGSYTDFENIEISVNNKNHITKVTARLSQPENNRIVYVIKELTTDPAKDINSYVSLAAWEDSYLDKSSYYTKILKTFKD